MPAGSASSTNGPAASLTAKSGLPILKIHPTEARKKLAMTHVPDLDSQSTQAKRLQDALGDKGRVLSTNTIVVPGSRRGTDPEVAGDAPSAAVIHAVSSGTYLDADGHIHAVLYDQVTTVAGGQETQVLEILSDVIVQ